MKRILLSLLLLLVVLVVAAGVLLLRLGDFVKYAVEEYGPKFAETAITVEKVDFSLLGGSATIDNLNVQNPEGFSDNRLLGLGHGNFAVKPTSLLSDVVDIKDITIRDPYFLLEFRGTGFSDHNLKALMDNINKNTAAADAKQEQAVEEGEKEPKKIIVRNFLLEGVKVRVKSPIIDQEITIPTIHFQDLGVTEGGITPADLTSEILGKVFNNIIEIVVVQVLGGQAVKLVEGVTGEVGEHLQNIGEGIGEGIGKGAEGVKKEIENLLPSF